MIAELARSLRWRAKKLFGLPSVKDLLTGAVAPVQRTGSALRLNVHFHILYLDGVYVRERAGNDPSLVVHALPAPTRAETDIARRIAERLERILKNPARASTSPLTPSPPSFS